jgi:RNA polymerase sigma factor (sigma-70 family)
MGREDKEDYGAAGGRDCPKITTLTAARQSRGRIPSYITMWSVSDDALLAGLATGDRDAAVAFVRRFQRRVFGLALTIVGEARGAEDVAQEAFLRAWRHAGVYDPRRGSVANWLLTITRNLAIDAVRIRRAVVVDPETVLGLDRPSPQTTPEELAVLSDDVDRLWQAMARLPAEQRRALVLAGLLGHTAREIGEAEGIPIGTAKTRIRTGLLRLRAALVSEERAE